jgi:hypothetical protein
MCESESMPEFLVFDRSLRITSVEDPMLLFDTIDERRISSDLADCSFLHQSILKLTIDANDSGNS